MTGNKNDGRDHNSTKIGWRLRPKRFSSMLQILDLHATDDPRDIVHRSVQAFVEGKVVGLPTDTVYGLAADALSESAVESLYELKGRPENLPLAISVGSREAAADFYCELTPLAQRLSPIHSSRPVATWYRHRA